ncbi:carbohydrate ABC transporter permease [Actinokineospora sp. HUAS TT18]|uniref:carbohydrate ABC transporter permease n=1 Tax=Actinokineospora sp. HUAS TT18 TaxID=3447451 RepID=UPI003F528A77
MSTLAVARRKPWTMSKVAVNGVLAVATVYMLMPLGWLVTASTKNAGELLSGRPVSLENMRLGENLGNVFSAEGGVYARWYLNSLLYAGVGATICAFICIAAGYSFHVYRFRGKEKVFGLVLAGVMVPTTALALPMYLLASKVGVVNTYWAVLLPCVVSPFGVYLARVFCAGYIPTEVLEAARIDGATEFRTFWSVGLKMVTPGFFTIFLFQFTAIWNNFFLPLVMLSDNKLFPLSLGLFAWDTQTAAFPEYYPLVVTGSLLAVIPLIAAFIILQRHWKAGLTAGAVK